MDSAHSIQSADSANTTLIGETGFPFKPSEDCIEGEQEIRKVLEEAETPEVKDMYNQSGEHLKVLQPKHFTTMVNERDPTSRPFIIGTGVYGVVMAGWDKRTSSRIVFKFQLRSRNTHQDIIREASAQLLASKVTDNVPKVLGVLMLREDLETAGLLQQYSSLVLVTECVTAVEGQKFSTMSLGQFTKNICNYDVEEKQMVLFFLELVTALEKFAALNLVHNDLHPDNILVNINDKVIKPMIIDFGRARCLSSFDPPEALPWKIADLSYVAKHAETVGKKMRSRLADIGQDMMEHQEQYSRVTHAEFRENLEGLLGASQQTTMVSWIYLTINSLCHDCDDLDAVISSKLQ